MNNRLIHYNFKHETFQLLKKQLRDFIALPFIDINKFLLKNKTFFNINKNEISNAPLSNTLDNTGNLVKYIMTFMKDLFDKSKSNEMDTNIEKFIKTIYTRSHQYYYEIGILANTESEKSNLDLFKVLLYNILNSDLSIITYMVDIMSKIIYNIDTIYKKYINDVNNLINNDYRFNNLDIEYRGIPIIDLLYNIFTNNNNTYIYNYGFYYKYNDVYINYIESYQGLKYIINYLDLTNNGKNE